MKIDGKPAASVQRMVRSVRARSARILIIPSNSTGITVSHSLLSLQDGGSILESLGGEKLEGNVLGPSTCSSGKYADNFKTRSPV